MPGKAIWITIAIVVVGLAVVGVMTLVGGNGPNARTDADLELAFLKSRKPVHAEMNSADPPIEAFYYTFEADFTAVDKAATGELANDGFQRAVMPGEGENERVRIYSDARFGPNQDLVHAKGWVAVMVVRLL